MRRLCVPVVVLAVGFTAAPATADTVSLNDACSRTLATLAGTGGTAGDIAFAGLRFRTGNRVVDAQAGTYGLLAQEGLRAKDRKAALGYLKAPSARAWRNAGSFYGTQWTRDFGEAVRLAAGLPADCAAAAGGLLSQSGGRYTYANVTVEIREGVVTRWGTISFTFTPQTVDLPAGGTVAYAAWQRASQAASLDATLRTITRTVAQTVPEATPTAIDAQLRAAVDPGRAVPLKVRQLRAGSLLSARNPYTKAYHAWRVYVNDGEAIARRVAP